METVGTVAQLWRYPVKSFQGEQVDELVVGSGGAEGDRTLAVVDPATCKVLSAKRYPDLLMASARLDGSVVVLTLPDGTEHDAADPGVHAAISSWLGMEVQLAPPPAEGVYPMEMYTGMSDEDTPLFDWAGPAGTWLDLADAHWLTTASLEAAGKLHPEGTWDVRRFRPTALVGIDAVGWREDAWTAVDLGEVGSVVMMPTPRCSMPSRAQPGLEQDKSIGATIRDHHHNDLGLYAQITRPGTIRLGDPVNAS